MQDIILSDTALKRNYFKTEQLGKIVNEHIFGKKKYGYCLWILIILEVWHREFFDK